MCLDCCGISSIIAQFVDESIGELKDDRCKESYEALWQGDGD